MDVFICGLACRMPESPSASALWTNLVSGRDMVTVDSRRWPVGYGGLPARSGKIDGLDRFDAVFFNVHGRQARVLEPQLRMLLEVGWEALVDAQIDPARLRGSATGVYVGATQANANIAWLRDEARISGYENTGAAQSMFANRLSYFFDFRGPSKCVDTACSSSLVALDDAVRDLVTGRCDTALVGGCNTTLWPALGMGFDRLQMLSPDGRCRSFDAAANGYVRSEGVGVVVLTTDPERAAHAYARVLATGVNSDGYTQQGITWPSASQQVSLTRRTCDEAGVDPGSVRYVEAHGTGTVAGDAQELRAIESVFGRDRSAESPLLIGSVKSNLGHCEGASGIAGLIKVLLSMEHGQLPPNLHFDAPNPSSPGLVAGRMRVVTEPTQWDGGRVAISSFGFGGTNAVAILEGTPSEDVWQAPVPGLVWSRTESGARAQVDAGDAGFTTPGADLKRFPWRGVVSSGAVRRVDTPSGPLVFAFGGLGAEHPGMGRGLHQHASFRSLLAACGEGVPVDLEELLCSPTRPFASVAERTVANVVFQMGVAEVLRAWGVVPHRFLGYSAGELACAWLAGTLTAAGTVRAAWDRGEAASAVTGAMIGVDLGATEVAELLPEGVVIAGRNAPDHCTLAGPTEPIGAALELLRSRGVGVRRLETHGIPYHSPAMADAARAWAGDLARESERHPPEPDPRWIWTRDHIETDLAAALAKGLAEPVDWTSALDALPRGYRVLEIGPRPRMAPLSRRARPDLAHDAIDVDRGIEETLGALWLSGVDVRAPIGRAPRSVRERQSAWDHAGSFPVPSWRDFGGSTLAGVFTTRVTLDLAGADRDILDHDIDGRILVPGVAYVMAAWTALAQKLEVPRDTLPVDLEDIELRQAVQVPESAEQVTLDVLLLPDDRWQVLRGPECIAEGRIRAVEHRDESPDVLTAYHRYPHGFGVLPVVAALGPALDLWSEAPRTVTDVAAQLGWNAGTLAACARALLALGWLEEGTTGLEPTSDLPGISPDHPALAWLDLERVAAELVAGETGRFDTWTATKLSPDRLVRDFEQGLVTVALLTALRMIRVLDDDGQVRWEDLPPATRTATAAHLERLGCGISKRDGFEPNTAGEFLLRQSASYQTIASYWRVFLHLEDWLAGSPRSWFEGRETRERHVDRAMNVRGSGFQHRRYFRDMADLLVPLFDDADAPVAVVDTGCGDGTLLCTLSEALGARSERVVFVGIDASPEAREATRQALEAMGVAHHVASGDVTEPEGIAATLAAAGIDPTRVLHIRSFLDHDRRWREPQRVGPDHGAVALDLDGGRRDPRDVSGSLVDHLTRWAKVVGPRGLALIEVFAEDEPGAQPVDASPSLHFDLYQSLSGQLLVPPAVFWECAAAAGLHARPDRLRHRPEGSTAPRIALVHLVPDAVRIRRATAEDLDALVTVERAAVAPRLQSDAEALSARLECGRAWVAEIDGSVVGAVYTQRVASLDVVRVGTRASVGRHASETGEILQLIGLAVDPRAARSRVAEKLIGLVRAVADGTSGIHLLAGVTRCRHWPERRGTTTYADHVADGEDPGLDLHLSGGARVIEVVEDWWPEDEDNDGHGVLIAYGEQGEHGEHDEPSAETVAPTLAELPGFVDRGLQWILPSIDLDGSHRDRRWEELGLDSLGLIALRSWLERGLGGALPPDVLFRHPTPRALSDGLASRARTTDDEDEPDQLGRAAVYGMMRRRGYFYGPSFQTVRSVREDGTSAVVRWDGSVVTFLDGLLQAGLLVPSMRERLVVPVAVRRASLRPPFPSTHMDVPAELDPGMARAACPFATFEGYRVQTLRRAPAVDPDPIVQRPVWVPYGDVHSDDHRALAYVSHLEAYLKDALGPHLEQHVADHPHLARVGRLLEEVAGDVTSFPEASDTILLRMARDLVGSPDRLAATLEAPMATINRHPEHGVLYGADLLARGFDDDVLAQMLAIVEENHTTALHVCEVGSGTGGLTRRVLERPSVSGIARYVATDVTRAFQSELERHVTRPVTHALWDVQSPVPARLGHFDLVLASNALHVADDLSIALHNVYEALRPGGFLCFFEATNRVTPLVWGLDASCWSFTDQRAFGLWTTIEHWKDLLRSAGFQLVSTHRALGDHAAMFLARRPTHAPVEHVRVAAPGDRADAPAIHEFLEAMSDRVAPRTWLTGPESALPLLRCARREPDGQGLRGLFGIEGPPDATRIEADLVQNVFRDGEWGRIHSEMAPLEQTDGDVPRWASARLSGGEVHLDWVALEAPARGEERIEVTAVALNFREIASLAGHLKAEDSPLPSYASHGVAGVGVEFVGRRADGTRVAGIADSTFATHVLAESCRISADWPATWTDGEVATIPVAYQTVYYTLDVRLRLRGDETVLVHSGAGGLGLALLHVLTARGHEVFVTCGTDAKRRFLLDRFPSLDAEHLGDSRKGGFEKLVRAATRNRGVDLVLNTLSGDLAAESMRCVAPGGTFVELGKRDLVMNVPYGLRPLLSNGRFEVVDLSMALCEPSIAYDLAERVAEGIRTGEVKPLPVNLYRASELSDAVRQMSKGAHIGKNVIEMDATPPPVEPHIACAPGHTWLVTGGLGGFGREMALWLGERGASRLVLSSRRGLRTGEQSRAVRMLRDRGIEVVCTTLDAADPDEARSLVELADSPDAPLEGVLHLAMVLEDRLIRDHDADSWRAAVVPKSHAARHLDARTRRQSVRWFVCFSSVAAEFGNPGQSNYAFGNAAMEEVCAQRQAAGHHALAIRWGPIAEVGWVAEQGPDALGRDLDKLQRQSVRSCTRTLEALMSRHTAGVRTVFVTQEDSRERHAEEAVEVGLLEGVLRTLGLQESQVRPETTLAEAGVDSLQIVEVQALLQKHSGEALTFSQIQSMDFATLRTLGSTNSGPTPLPAVSTPKAVGSGPLVERGALIPARPDRVVLLLAGLATDPTELSTGRPVICVRWERASDLPALVHAIEAELQSLGVEVGVELWTHSIAWKIGTRLLERSDLLRRRCERWLVLSPPSAAYATTFLDTLTPEALRTLDVDAVTDRIEALPFFETRHGRTPLGAHEVHRQITLAAECGVEQPLQRPDLVVLPRQDTVCVQRAEAASWGQVRIVDGDHELVGWPHASWDAISATETRPTVLLFPGQGAQRVGMGAHLFDRFPTVVDEAESILGLDLRRLCLEDPDRVLDQTEYAQPALFVVNELHRLAYEAEGGPGPSAAAGHSLGEYNALVAAGVLAFRPALVAVRERGRVMATAPAGAMAAVIGLSARSLSDLLSTHGIDLDLANYNSATQTVISGTTEEILKSEAVVVDAGARWVRLRVSRAFHSRHMTGPSEAFRRALDGLEIHAGRFPVIANATARPYGSDVHALLAQQLRAPVRWAETMAALSPDEPRFFELGPGTTLSRLIPTP